jgi:hypothetical protein
MKQKILATDLHRRAEINSYSPAGENPSLEERLATTSELNPIPGLVTGCCEAGGMGYQPQRRVLVISPEILMILEADVVCVTEGSIHTTVSPNLRSWNIAESSGTLLGDVSPAGSQTVAWCQRLRYTCASHYRRSRVMPADGRG